MKTTRKIPIVSTQDKQILRELGRKKAEIAALPVQQERRRLWTSLNDLHSVRPMVWVFEVPWHEMDVNGELTLRCESQICRDTELALRRELYQWTHMQGDMVIAPAITVPPVLHDTGFGLDEQVDIVKTDDTNPVVSRNFHIQIKDEQDIDKIQMPTVTLDNAEWDTRYCLMSEIFDKIIPVHKIGWTGTTISPWDYLVRLTGIEEILLDMCTRPDYVHRIMDRLTNAYIARLDQYEKLNIMAFNNDIWSGGGYSFTDELPQPDCNQNSIRTQDMWGRTMAQIFSAVSPAMHEEFSLQYECRWLNRFGLTYYGCCEPLHKKIDILRRNIPNLRKISMSPWIDLNEAAENVGTEYVFSYKPNPVILAGDEWNPELFRRNLREALSCLRTMHVEIILKDISTVQYAPQRLWEWTRIASELASEFR